MKRHKKIMFRANLHSFCRATGKHPKRGAAVRRPGTGSISGPMGLPSASIAAVGAVLLLLLSLVSGCSLILFIRLHSGLFGAVCWFVSAAPVRVGFFLPLPAAWGLVRVLPFLCCWSASWAGSASWSVPFGISCCCLRCYTYSHHCVSL